MLKTAFVHGRLTRDELGARTGQALTARTYADLVALTADIPPGPAAAGPASPPAPARRPRLASPPVAAGICLIITVAAVMAGAIIAPEGSGPHWSVAELMLVLAITAMFTGFGIMGCALVTALDQRSSRGQLPPRPGAGGHVLEAEQRGGAGHDPVPPGPRNDQTRADSRARKSRPHRQHVPARAGRAPRAARPAPGPV